MPVVTDFERRAQPMIRYRLNDILVERKEACGCKSPCLALEKIEGREDDMFSFRDIQGREKLIFPDFIRRCILFAGVGRKERAAGEQAGKAAEGAWEYRVVQNPDRNVTVYADLTAAEREAVRREFQRLARDREIVLPDITFAPYDWEVGKKLKRVQRIR